MVVENKLVYHFFPHRFSQTNGKQTSQGTKPPTIFSSSTLHFTMCKMRNHKCWTSGDDHVMFTVAVGCREWLCAFVASAKDYCSITILLIQLLMLTRGCDSHKTLSALLRCKIKKTHRVLTGSNT